jgi:hypothetical protein
MLFLWYSASGNAPRPRRRPCPPHTVEVTAISTFGARAMVRYAALRLDREGKAVFNAIYKMEQVLEQVLEQNCI